MDGANSGHVDARALLKINPLLAVFNANEDEDILRELAEFGTELVNCAEQAGANKNCSFLPGGLKGDPQALLGFKQSSMAIGVAMSQDADLSQKLYQFGINLAERAKQLRNMVCNNKRSRQGPQKMPARKRLAVAGSCVNATSTQELVPDAPASADGDEVLSSDEDLGLELSRASESVTGGLEDILGIRHEGAPLDIASRIEHLEAEWGNKSHATELHSRLKFLASQVGVAVKWLRRAELLIGIKEVNGATNLPARVVELERQCLPAGTTALGRWQARVKHLERWFPSDQNNPIDLRLPLVHRAPKAK